MTIESDEKEVVPIWKTQCGRAIAFLPDGNTLAVAGARGPTRLLDAATGKELLVCEGLKTHISGIAFSPDGCRIAVAQMYDRITICDASSGKLLCKGVFGDTKASHLEQFSGLAYSKKTGELLRSAWKRAVDVIDPITAQAKDPLQPSNSTRSIMALSFFAEGNRLAALWASKGGRGLNVIVWSWPERQAILRFSVPNEFAHSIAVSSDESLIAVPYGSITAPEDLRGIYLFDTMTGQQLLKVKTNRTLCCTFTPKGNRLIAPDGDRVCVWNSKTGERLITFSLPSSEDVTQTEVSPDGKFLAVATWRGVFVWQLAHLLEICKTENV